MNALNQIEQILVNIGAISSICISGFISSEWASKEAADLAAEQMARVGCDGATVALIGSTYFCNWNQQ